MKITKLAVLFMAMIAVLNCAGTDVQHQRNMTKNAFIGGAVGSAAGAALGMLTGNPVEGAVIGAVAGAAAWAINTPKQIDVSSNPGAMSAYQQGLSDRNAAKQERLEDRAYRAGRGHTGYGKSRERRRRSRSRPRRYR